MLQIVEVYPDCPVYADAFEHPPPWLASWCPVWSYMSSVDTVTQWREDWLSVAVVNHTIVTDPTIWQPGFHLPRHTYGLWRTVSRHKAHAVLTCTNGVSPNHLPVIVASNRPWTTLSTRVHQQNLKADWIYSTKQMMTQSYGWNLQQLQHARNKQIVIMWCWCFRDGPRVGYRTTQSYFWICQRRWWNDHTLWESQER